MTAALLAKAHRALESAALLLAAGDTDGAVNRAYYAMFDAATAALLACRPDGEALPKSHAGLISRFGHQLVRSGRIPAELGRSPNRLHELQLVADYLGEPVSMDKATGAVEEAQTFVAAMADVADAEP